MINLSAISNALLPNKRPVQQTALTVTKSNLDNLSKDVDPTLIYVLERRSRTLVTIQTLKPDGEHITIAIQKSKIKHLSFII